MRKGGWEDIKGCSAITVKTTNAQRAVLKMDFCQKCSSVMIPQKKGNKVILVCKVCGAKKPYSKKSFKIAEHIPKEGPAVTVIEKEFLSLPKTSIPCPKCNHTEAYWWLQQTRSADEAPTLFFRCTKCNYSWRQYG